MPFLPTIMYSCEHIMSSIEEVHVNSISAILRGFWLSRSFPNYLLLIRKISKHGYYKLLDEGWVNMTNTWWENFRPHEADWNGTHELIMTFAMDSYSCVLACIRTPKSFLISLRIVFSHKKWVTKFTLTFSVPGKLVIFTYVYQKNRDRLRGMKMRHSLL